MAGTLDLGRLAGLEMYGTAAEYNHGRDAVPGGCHER